jgi:glycosyltransferase involved in cell wall biosynthesis
MKTLSVIIPARNEEAVIVRTVAAAVASAHALAGKRGHLDETEVEILVVDNASTDRTREVLEPWVRNFGVRVLECPVPRAPCARNYGAHRAHGRILVFVDADTLMPEDTLSRIAWLCDAEGYEGGFTRLAPIEDSVRARVWWTFWEHVRALPIAKAKAMSALMFCTREVFFELGGFNETKTLGEEWSILAGLYAKRPHRFAYDRTLTAMTSSRRMELQPFGYTRVLLQYVRVVLQPDADIDYTDAIRDRAA